MKKINLNEIENDKMMSPYEMKNVTGGSGDCATDYYGNYCGYISVGNSSFSIYECR